MSVRRKAPVIDAAPVIEFAERTGRKPVGQTSWARAWHRMRKSGTITIPVADRFCIEVLGEHPVAVFGTDWESAG